MERREIPRAEQVAKRPHYPTAWIKLELLLEDFGQPDPKRLIHLEGIPLELRVEINAFQEADTSEVTFSLDDFPFDPRILKGGTVEVYLADAAGTLPGSGLHRAPGIGGFDFWAKRTPEEMRGLCLFVGVIDVAQGLLGDDGREFKVKARDYTAYFLDATSDPSKVIVYEKGVSLRELIEKVIAERETTTAITVDNRAADVFPADYKRRAPDPKKGVRRPRNGEKLWDIITELALEAGLVAYVELDQIVIREPATIFSDRDPDRLIRWTLGGDIWRLTASRDLGRQHGINVQVTSYDPDAKRTIVALAPKDGETEPKEEVPAAKVGSGSARSVTRTVQRTYRPFVVRGVTDQAHLQKIADQIRQQLRHHELEASLESSAMTDSRGRLVQSFRYGDPIEVAISEGLSATIGQPVEVQIRRLIEVGYADQDAKAVALSLDRLRVPWYVHRVRHTLSTRGESRYEIEIEARSRKQVDLGEDLHASPPQKEITLKIERG